MTSDTHRQTVAEARHTCRECGYPVAKKAVLCFSCWAKESGQESLGDRLARLERERDEAVEALEDAPLPSLSGGPKDFYQRHYQWWEKTAKPAISRIKGADRE